MPVERSVFPGFVRVIALGAVSLAAPAQTTSLPEFDAAAIRVAGANSRCMA